jgi:uncharacterized protein YggE
MGRELRGSEGRQTANAIGGTMKVSTFAAIAVLAVFAAGCGSKERGIDGTAAQGDVAISAEAGDLGAQPIAYQTGGSATGTLPGITVVGMGTARAVPDVADWSFGVQSEAESASAALEGASSATREILAALRDAGIAQEDLRTEQVSLYPRTTDDGRAVIGYTASSSVHATVRELEEAGAVVDAAVRAGANQVYGPSLRVSDSREQYSAAAEAAIDDARARAEALAAKAGLTLGAPVAIIESGAGVPGPLYDRAMAGAEAAGVPIEPGVNEITATLTVTFAIS